MENASKALIIAGAILLAILLISLGIMIFNQAQDTVDNSGMSQAEITAFNNKFLKYEGDNKTGSEVKALVNEVRVSNADSSNAQRKIGVRLRKNNSFITIINSKTNQPGIIKDEDNITTNKNYSVTMKYSNGKNRNNNDETKGCIFLIELGEVQ